jgi:cell filamentation protein
VTFDPFKDFEERGYLRNKFGEKNFEIIKHLEHTSFVGGVSNAFGYLAGRDTLTYDDVLETHRILFQDIYPWAGRDRSDTAPDIAVGKGGILFAHPEDARNAVEYGLRLAQNKPDMVKRPGEVMGYFAYGHPFLDGNGRTIMVVHTELAERAGISINWAAATKTEYLSALSMELNKPGRNHLDTYLRPFISAPLGRKSLEGHVRAVQGLGGASSSSNKVEGLLTDPSVQKRYKQLAKQRRPRRGPGDL